MTTVVKIKTSGEPRVGQLYSLSCVVTKGSGNLIWTDSSGQDLNSSNGSKALVFPSLKLSDVGNYTCNVAFANGDFREVTEEILAIGNI